MEWNYYRSIGGSVYFITLTYDDEHLPTCTLPSGKVITGFNKTDIHNFIKYLRIFLARSHLEHKDIKYLICSEYSDKNTKRPHYHGLLFFPYHLPCVGHNSLFNRVIERAWQNGWIVCSEFGWQIMSVKGIRYATKYVCKDIGFYNDFLRDYLDCSDKDIYKQRLEFVKDYLPRHWQSVGFGAPFINIIERQQDIASFLFNDKYTLNMDKSPIYRIPRYYHLKYEKAIAKDLSRLLDKVVLVNTPVGKEVRSMRLKRSLHSYEMKLSEMLSPNYLDSFFPSETSFQIAREWFRKRVSLSGAYDFIFSSYDDLKYKTIEYIRKYLPLFDLHQFASYSLFLRYLPIFEDEFPEDKFSSVSEVFSHMVDSPNVPPEVFSLGLCSGADFVATPLKDDVQARKQITCSNHPFFHQYEMLCLAIDRFNLVRNVVQDYTSWKKEDDNRKIKAWKPKKIKKYRSVL